MPMKSLRTPDARFVNLSGVRYAPRYTEVPDGEGGTLRIHHIDEGRGPAVLCMHGQPTWSYLYRHMIPVLVAAGLRVIAPDLVGFGRSDKPAAREDYTYERQVAWFDAWLRKNDLRDLTFLGQDWGGLIGLRVVAAKPERFARVVVANTGLPAPQDTPQANIDAVRRFREEAPTPTLPEMQAALTGRSRQPVPELAFAHWQKWTWETEDIPVGALIAGSVDGRTLSAGEVAAYDAPFPDPSYKMGPRAMPSQVPTLSTSPSAAENRRAWEVFARWEKPLLCAFSDNDPVTGGGSRAFLERVPGAKGQPHATIQGGGHFLQEGRGVELAEIVARFVKSA
jgi:haloalkane dehalogenase